MKNFLNSFLEQVPLKYRQGPWHLAAYAFLITMISAIIEFWTMATNDLRVNTHSAVHAQVLGGLMMLQTYRLYLAIFMALTTVAFVAFAGWLPLSSYTMTSWNLLCMRLLTAYFADGAPWHPSLTLAARFLRFPALVGNTGMLV